MISVITPAFNAAATLLDAIESFLSQSYKDWEMLIVDDGSTDDTLYVAQRAQRDPRIHVLAQANKGVSAARNAALDGAEGRYVAFLDADDIWMPRKLEMQLAFMSDTQSAFSFTGYRKVSLGRVGGRSASIG